LTKIDESDCKERTLESVEGPVKYIGVEDASDDEGEDENGDDDDDDVTSDLSTDKEMTGGNKAAVDKPKAPSAVSRLSEYERARAKRMAENEALKASLGLGGGAKKLVFSESQPAGTDDGSKKSEDAEKVRSQEEGCAIVVNPRFLPD
jgi:hypothetical protein